MTISAFVLPPPLELGVSCWVWAALNEVHLEELGFWGWVFLLWGGSWWENPCPAKALGTALLLPGLWWVQQSLTLSWLGLWWAGDTGDTSGDLGLL